MDVVCQGGWRAGSLLWQPRPGAWALTIACHAVFALAPGESHLVAGPLEPPDGEGDERVHVEPWARVAPVKQRSEVVVVGHAHAPAGSKVSSLLVRLAVGELDKLIRVHGDSALTADGAIAVATPFTRMPLSWRRAAGGPGTSNPEGVPMGPAAPRDARGRAPLPNIRPPGMSITRPDQIVPPAGFGPLGPDSPVRAQRLRQHAATWDAARWSERPLPPDFDLLYFNVAPPDQTLAQLTGAERIALEHLHPRASRLATYLRGPTPRAVASIQGVDQVVPLRCDTLVIDADRALAVLVWRGCLALDHPRREGIVLVSSGDVDASATSAPVVAAPGAQGAALPFRAPAAPTRPGPASLAPPPLEEAARPARPGRAVTMVMPDPAGAAAPAAIRPALPFGPPAPTPPEWDEEPPTPPRQVAPPPFHVREPEPAVAPPPPLVVLRPPLEAPPPLAAPPPPAPAPVAPAPAPLAVLAQSPQPTAPAPSAPPAVPEPPPPSAAPTLEQCAALDARLALRPAERAVTLGAENLDEGAWGEHHARWQGDIQLELRRGKRKLLATYDRAYVAALEDERGLITARDYARISVAEERGQGARRLEELRLPGEALMRIRRVWMERMTRDPKAAAEVRAATGAAREE